MYHYILTLFTNVCFSRNNGILNSKKTLVYDWVWLGSIKRARAPQDTLARLVVQMQIGYIAYKLQSAFNYYQQSPVVMLDHDRIHTSIRWQVETSSMNSSQMQIYDYHSSRIIVVNDQAYNVCYTLFKAAYYNKLSHCFCST